MIRSLIFAAVILAGFAGFTKITNYIATNNNTQTGLNVGNTAPELKYQSPDGKEIST